MVIRGQASHMTGLRCKRVKNSFCDSSCQNSLLGIYLKMGFVVHKKMSALNSYIQRNLLVFVHSVFDVIGINDSCL